MGKRSSKEENTTELANVYIFNKIKNNKKDVELLRTTFESLMCVVSEIKVLPKKYSELKEIVKEIIRGDFSEFNYIVIIILDNENQDEYIWKTQDNKNFHINGDLITAITANKTLEGKLRFSIIQTNRVSGDEVILREIKPQKCYSGKDVKYYATSTECALTHAWKDNEPSPFIEILCAEITQNSQQPVGKQLTIDKMLDQISRKVAEKTDESPSKVPLLEPYILGNGRKYETDDALAKNINDMDT